MNSVNRFEDIKKIDFHMHTTVSDGTDSPEMILDAVKESGIDVFAVTDHDAIRASVEIPGFLKAGDPGFITGVEFSCKDEKGKYHILGYGYDPNNENIVSLVAKGHALRIRKMQVRLEFLKEEFGFIFDEKDVEKLFALDNPGKPHLANMLVEYGYVASKEEGFSYLNEKYFKTEYVRPEEAIEGIKKSGGIPILAHPTYGDGDNMILGKEMEDRVLYLLDFGLEGLEAFYSGFTDKMIKENLGYGEKYNLYITAGSDYHGRNKLVILGDTNLTDMTKAPKGLRRFIEDVNIIG